MPTVMVDSKTLDLASVSSAEALQILKGLAAQLGKGRDAKTGTLNIVGRDGQWQIRRQSGWSRFWNFGFQRSLGERKTAEVLDTLVRTAFGNRLPSSKAVASLHAYLGETTHVDAKKLSMLLHDAIVTKHLRRRDDIPPTSDRLGRSGDIRSMSESEVLAELGGVRDKYGNRIDKFHNLKPLAKGAEGSYGFVADIPPDESGKPRVIKIEKNPEVVNLKGHHGHRSRDVSAAYLRGLDGVLNVPGVIAPTHLIFRRKIDHDKLYLVPSENVRAFLATKKSEREKGENEEGENEKGELEFVGQVMPKVDGHSLAQCNKGEEGASPLDEVATHTAARQMHWTLVRLATHGFVHHDIKPANFMWDSARGRVSMLDFGMLHKLHKKPDSPLIKYTGGTPLYRHPQNYHPDAARGHYHGPEYDAFSTAITLLETAAISDPLTQDFAQRRDDLARFRIKTKIPSDDSYLLNWLKATPKNHPLYAAYKQRIGPVDEVKPTVENYCHHLIQASFLTGDAYLNRMKELALHPYLVKEFGGPPTNHPSSVQITSGPDSTSGSRGRIHLSDS